MCTPGTCSKPRLLILAAHCDWSLFAMCSAESTCLQRSDRNRVKNARDEAERDFIDLCWVARDCGSRPCSHAKQRQISGLYLNVLTDETRDARNSSAWSAGVEMV
jgi:hypothetical protein